jgi:hypothetical protein
LSEPRRVTVSLGQLKRLTILELARAQAIAKVRQSDAERLLRTLVDKDADPAELELAARMLYAWTWQLVRRDEPAATWQEAQTWRVELDLDAVDDPYVDEEARAVVEVAIATGLPPREAAQVTFAELEAYGDAAEAMVEKLNAGGR